MRFESISEQANCDREWRPWQRMTDFRRVEPKKLIARRLLISLGRTLSSHLIIALCFRCWTKISKQQIICISSSPVSFTSKKYLQPNFIRIKYTLGLTYNRYNYKYLPWPRQLTVNSSFQSVHASRPDSPPKSPDNRESASSLSKASKNKNYRLAVGSHTK